MLSRVFKMASQKMPKSLSHQTVRQVSTYTTVGDDFEIDSLQNEKSCEELLVKQPWSTRPFLVNQDIQLPVYNLITGDFTGEICTFDQTHFNLPLRRDIIAQSFHYWMVKGKVRTKMVKRSGDVAGTGRKPAPQKGRGKARIGNRRAPQRRGGGKAMGPVPQDLTEKLSVKVRIKALQCALSAKLYENKIVIIDTEKVEHARTNYVSEILKPFGIDRLTFLCPTEMDQNFKLACGNIKNVETKWPQAFNVPHLVKSDICFFTKQGLFELEEIIESRVMNHYRNKKVVRDFDLPYFKYIKKYSPKSRRDPDWNQIIKPTLYDEQLEEQFSQPQEDKDLHIFTPSVYKYMQELKSIQKQAEAEETEETSEPVKENQ